jgi:hypothetical protein
MAAQIAANNRASRPGKEPPEVIAGRGEHGADRVSREGERFGQGRNLHNRPNTPGSCPLPQMRGCSGAVEYRANRDHVISIYHRSGYVSSRSNPAQGNRCSGSGLLHIAAGDGGQSHFEAGDQVCFGFKTD